MNRGSGIGDRGSGIGKSLADLYPLSTIMYLQFSIHESRTTSPGSKTFYRPERLRKR